MNEERTKDSNEKHSNDNNVKAKKRSNRMQREVKLHKNGQMREERILNGKHLISSRTFGVEGQLINERVFNILSDGNEERYTSYFGNGVRKLEINLKNKKVNGLATFWHENGRLSMRKNIINDIADGPCTEWNEQGVKTHEYNYKNGEIEVNDMFDFLFPEERESLEKV